MPGILVGVDGSDHSRRALDWAIREAANLAFVQYAGRSDMVRGKGLFGPFPGP